MSVRTLYQLMLLGFLGLGVAGPVRAQYRTPLDDLLYPGAVSHDWGESGSEPVHLLFSKAQTEQVLLYYLAVSRQADWRLTYPSEWEARAWLDGLEKTRKSPVFMLNLYHLKSKVNYNLTIGPVSGTSPVSARSIITIYSTRRPFDGRQGG